MSYTPNSASSVQWSELQHDACSNVIDRLDVLDLQNFAAVCTSWSTICLNLHAARPKSGSPTLLTSRLDHDGGRTKDTLVEGTFALHDVSEGTSFCVCNRSLVHRVWVGGKNDWLVISDKRCSLQLLNLITGETLPLPSFSTVPGIEIDHYSDLSIACQPYSRTLRRVVLCQTPSSSSGHFAISLFDDGILAFTTKGDNTWTFFNHPTSYCGSRSYFPEIFMDSLVHKGRVVAVDSEGFVFSWPIGDQDVNPVSISSADIPFVFGSRERVFYLAKSPCDELILICVRGHGPVFMRPYNRVLKSEHDRFEIPDSMILFKYDDARETWRRIRTTDLGASLFVGLNYPFYVTCNAIKPNSVYVANMVGSDVTIFAMQAESDVPIEKHNYPIKEQARPGVRQSLRTPMWFRPTVPENNNTHIC
ncbi:unnamed protein product [Urochloa decumbens]|uniref:DUF295 domain-containing protein n=1 Tax=Urochloa decumbens TaxID=240449 RepID=A0ABC8ZLL2_9POAL